MLVKYDAGHVRNLQLSLQGFQDPGMNSFSHYSFGAVAAWAFRVIGGLRPAAPGWTRAVVRAVPGGGLTWAECAFDSPAGRRAAPWALWHSHGLDSAREVP